MAVSMVDARLAGTTVTPTRRLAHHLRQRHDHEALARGLSVWPTPDIVPWSALIERMFQADRAAGRTHRRWLGDSGARLAWERILLRDPATAGVIAPEGLARQAQRSWQTRHDYQIPLATAELADGPEVAAFARWSNEFAEWIDQDGWMDLAGAPDWVDPSSAGPRLTFVGFDTLTPSQSAFIERMREGGVEVRVEASPAAAASARWVSVPDRTTEIEWAARWAAGQLDGIRGRRIAIVVPGLAQARASVRRVLDRVLAPETCLTNGPAPESRAYELAAARPLAEQPVVAAALEWFAAVNGDLDLASASALLRNPFCRGAAEEASARAALDAWLRRHVANGPGLEGLARHAARRGCGELARALEGALAARAGWERRALPSTWSLRCFETLRELGWPGDALDSHEQQARQRWQDLLGEFGAHDDLVGPVTAGAALRLLRDLADATLFEPQEVRAPLLVIDAETCAGMRFDALWVCGLDAGQWPSPQSPDPFLPRSWQLRRGVPGATPEITAAAARRSFERLRGSAGEVIFSVPAFEDEAPLLPSALLADVPPSELPESWPAPAPSRAIFAARPACEASGDGTLPPFATGADAPGGARLLELQSACPFRAAAELRLGARALEEPSRGLDAATRGNLVHELFASLWEGVRSSTAMAQLPEGERVARVRVAIARGLAPLREQADPVLQRLLDLEARWLERHALRLLAADLARPPFEVAHVESAHALEIGGLALRLRVDRVDRLAGGASAVIDYKTGGNAQKGAWLGERPELPQLPLYVQALQGEEVAAVAFGRVRAGETGYVGIARDSDEFPGTDDLPKEYASWDELLAAWRRRLESLAHEFASGDARLAPNPSKACRHCHLPRLCRIGAARLAEAGEGDDDA